MGDPIMHIGLFLGVVFIPINQTCLDMSYTLMMQILIASHFINGCRFVISSITAIMVPIFPSLTFGLFFVEKLMDFVGVILALFAIIFVQDVFYFSSTVYGLNLDCSFKTFGATRLWLGLEIWIFYSGFISNCLFIWLSEFYLKRTGIAYREKKVNINDFLLRYKTINGLYQTFAMLLSATAYCLYWVNTNTDPDMQREVVAVNGILIGGLLVHILQFIAINVQFFIDFVTRTRKAVAIQRMQVAFIIVVPSILVLGQLVWLIKFRTLLFDFFYFKWIITDAFLNVFLLFAYMMQLERIAFEQKETSEVFLSIEDRDHAIQGDKPAPAAPPPKLQLGGDYYALSFCAFMKHFRDKHSISSEQKSMFFANVCFIYGIQIFMLILAYYDMMIQIENKGSFLTMTHFDVTLSKILLSFLMHMQSEPEIRQALRMWRYVLNHGKARGSIIKLYKDTCGKMHPLPEDPAKISPQILNEAFNQLKKYQRDNQIHCRHPIDPQIEFLLGICDKHYQSRVIGPFGLQPISLMKKWLYNRECRENSLSRDEIYQIYVSLGVYFPGKRADDLFFRSNSDGDTIISQEEFVDIYMKEFAEREQKRLKIAENFVRLRDRLNRGMCSFVTQFFKSNSQKIAAKKNFDNYQKEQLEMYMNELTKFANKLRKEEKTNNFVLANAEQKLQVDDKEALEKILHFFKSYQKDNAEEGESDGEDFYGQQNLDGSQSNLLSQPSQEALPKLNKRKPIVTKSVASSMLKPSSNDPVVVYKLDPQKIDVLLEELQTCLSADDIFEIKKQINELARGGKLIPQRVKFMETRQKLNQEKAKMKVGNVTQYVFEDPLPAILISLMQLTSAFFTECINIHMVCGQLTVSTSFQFFVAFKVISLVDNIYLGAIQDVTMQEMQTGAWQPLIIYKKLLWEARSPSNKFWYVNATLFNLFYKGIYFYFWPFVTLLIGIVSPVCTSKLVLNSQASLQNMGSVTYTPTCAPYNSFFLTKMFTAPGIW